MTLRMLVAVQIDFACQWRCPFKNIAQMNIPEHTCQSVVLQTRGPCDLAMPFFAQCRDSCFVVVGKSSAGDYGFHHRFFNFQIHIFVATSGEKLNVVAFAAGHPAFIRLATFDLSQRFAQSLPKAVRGLDACPYLECLGPPRPTWT